MPQRWWQSIVISLKLWLALTVLTGMVYPAVVACVGEAFFSHAANGGLIEVDGKPVGAGPIGQCFDDPQYFWSRPSATLPMPCNGAASSGSNLALTNPAWRAAVERRIAALQSVDPGNRAPIPVDLVTASASGLDPDISPAAAQYQAARVARGRGLPVATVDDLVAQHIENRQWGLFGEPRVNVLRLNLALDELERRTKKSDEPRRDSP